jgi:hypothetical protein
MGVPSIIPFYAKYTPLIIPITFFTPCSVVTHFLKKKGKVCEEMKEMMWKLIDD